MIKILHWFALRMSDVGMFIGDAGERLWELGGNLEGWCDERTYRRKWMRWGKENGVSVHWLDVPDFDPSELSMPMSEDAPKPRPFPTNL